MTDFYFGQELYTAGFDENGMLKSIRTPAMSVQCNGLEADVGVNGCYVRESLGFQSFLDFNTWSLPEIHPQLNKRKHGEYLGGTTENGVLTQRFACGPLEIGLLFHEDCGLLAVDTVVCNRSGETLWINGTALELNLAISQPDRLTFDFPGNVPYGSYAMKEMTDGKPVETGLVNAVTHLEGENGHLNLLYINGDEKWSTGVYRNGNDLHWTAIASTEAELKPGEQYQCGTLYLQPLGNGDRFAPIRDFYYAKGWRVPTDGVKDAVVYSCHPSGTMDTDWPLHYTLQEFDQFTPGLAKMGIDTIWLLPIFDHYQQDDPERNVYTPLNHEDIDHRYGGDGDVKHYIDHARELGARVIFDYVPHGPRPQDKMGVECLDKWASRRRDGSPQEEWTCLSFDMANPTYLDYLKNMVKDHIDRFGLGGTRIDCAMGGLSNWRPYPGNRPSNSNMKGGVSVSQTMRQAFVEKGITPFVTPENFHPIPLYNSCTDAYYDMALYRILHDLNKAGLSPKDYVFELTRWLEHQLLSTPEGLNKLRFLGNHDTVSWVWDCKRATAIYGVDRAKAMWVLISLIDGCPMIYQGDEHPEFYLNDTAPVLEDFFADLFAAKKAYTSHEYRTVYEYTNTGLFAFRRIKDDEKLILINLDDQDLTYPLTGPAKILYGSGELSGNTITLKPSGYALLQY